MGEETVAH